MAWAFVRLSLLIGAAIPLALRQAEVWKKPPEELVVLCLLTIALVGAGEPFVARMNERRRRVVADQMEQLKQRMTLALVDIAHLVSLPCQDIGVHLYVVQHPSPKRLRKPHLDRLLRVRLSSVPVSSDIRWSRGKGVVGSCWQQERDLAIDLHVLHEPHYACDEHGWQALPPEVTLQMTFSDFERTRGKYGVVLATPMTRELGGVIGVVTVDGPCGRSAALDTGPVRTALRRLADDMRRDLGR